MSMGKERLYTLDEAKYIIRKNIIRIMKQKLIGIVSIVLCILSAIVMRDITIGCILIPLGLYLILTRKKIICL